MKHENICITVCGYKERDEYLKKYGDKGYRLVAVIQDLGENDLWYSLYFTKEIAE